MQPRSRGAAPSRGPGGDPVVGIAVLDRDGRIVDVDAEVRAIMARCPELTRQLASGARSARHRSGWSDYALSLPDCTLRIRMLVDAAQKEVVAFVAEAECPCTLDLSKLSPREVEVARLVGDGATDAQISRRLKIALATVRWHLTNIYRKTRLRDRAALAAAAAALACKVGAEP